MATSNTTLLQFRSMYRGKARFDVWGGPMADRTVDVTDLPLSFYEQDWNGGHGWALSREAYERDVLGCVGMITCAQAPVTDDVIDAYKAFSLRDLDKAEIYTRRFKVEGMDAAHWDAERQRVNAIVTGHWDGGWHRQAPQPMAPIRMMTSRRELVSGI